jgi:enoyl-CoA hydratase/carnithine racemase
MIFPLSNGANSDLNLILATEMMGSMIDHKKVLVLALNGPGVGGEAVWFPGVADMVLAAKGAYLQLPFTALGLVPENGSALSFRTVLACTVQVIFSCSAVN